MSPDPLPVVILTEGEGLGTRLGLGRGGFALKCARNTPFFEKGFILLSELLRKVSLVIRASL